MRNKIINIADVSNLCNELRAQGKKIVSTNGSFDLFHYGHVLFLQEAKRQGDVLIVGVNDDDSVRRWKKFIGYQDYERRPINKEEARVKVLAALECVDYVTVFHETDCLNFVEVVKPDVHVNGSDYGEDCIEAPIVKKYGGKIHIVKIIDGFSSSEIIKKILEIYQNDN